MQSFRLTGIAMALAIAFLSGCVELPKSAELGHILLIEASKPDSNSAKVTELIKSGADVNVQGANGLTPLMRAAGQGRPDIVEILLQAGANIDAKDIEGKTSLMGVAMSNVEPDVAKVLIRHGAKLDERANSGDTALIFAAKFGHEQVAREIINAGAKLHEKDSNGRTALVIAASCQPETLKALIEKGALSDEQDALAALHEARSTNYKFCVDLILEKLPKRE